ncbi:hypothetical protein D3OALGA1CA_756 [Olavius algarvensis associated proteobacterium Delta 3]|nr:hypothetical protein D3OALGA1CA_756 [Olavius algarvensis associated proteobacterium Delta 3]CAB5152924.1 hypothetical protein D3OALGB2SA_4912 [Olavius algarvensis associated proteobacterium Delta 3]
MRIMASSDLFDCRMCGDCCRGYGGTYLTRRDITAISGFIKLDAIRFQDIYCALSGGRPVLAQRDDGYCVFWDGKCRIHPVKPRMCRAWPFIEAIVTDVNNWYSMAGSCPGMRTDAPPEEILACVKRELNRL